MIQFWLIFFRWVVQPTTRKPICIWTNTSIKFPKKTSRFLGSTDSISSKRHQSFRMCHMFPTGGRIFKGPTPPQKGLCFNWWCEIHPGFCLMFLFWRRTWCSFFVKPLERTVALFSQLTSWKVVSIGLRVKRRNFWRSTVGRLTFLLPVGSKG